MEHYITISFTIYLLQVLMSEYEQGIRKALEKEETLKIFW
jgi:hypothetical protein